MTRGIAARAAPPPWRPPLRRDEGSASLELVIVFPALLLLITVLIQYGLWFHARTLAQAAAAEGVTAARVLGSTPEAGRVRAETFLSDHAAGTLVDTQVTAGVPTTGQVSVEVRGRVISVVPLLPGPTVVQIAQGPVERFTTAGDP